MAKKDFSALRGKKNVQNETLPSNDDGQPVANLFAADYDKEAFAWRSCIKKSHRDMTGRACKRVFLM